MCFGGKPNDTGASSGSVRLSQIDPSRDQSRTSQRPPTSGRVAERPTTSSTRRQQRPHTSSARERPVSSRRDRPAGASARERPTTSRRDRPASASARERQTPRSSSGVDRHSAQPRSQISSIPEQYPEDRTIIGRVANLSTLIDQHAQYYYLHDHPTNEGIQDLDNPRTRHAAIRRHIAKTIINLIIMMDRYETAICEGILPN